MPLKAYTFSNTYRLIENASALECRFGNMENVHCHHTRSPLSFGISTNKSYLFIIFIIALLFLRIFIFDYTLRMSKASITAFPQRLPLRE